MAALLQVLALLATLLILRLFPQYDFESVLPLLALTLTGLTWGAAPSLLALLVGGLLLDYFILPPTFSFQLAVGDDVIGLALFLLAGCAISVAVSQTERARRNAERLAASLANEHARSERANRQLHLLQGISDTVLAHLVLDELLRDTLDHLREALAVENAAILLMSQDGQELTIRAMRGPGADIIPVVRVPFGRGVVGRIAATREPMLIADLTQVEVMHPFLGQVIRSLLGVPLIVQDQVIGVLHIGTVRFHSFTQDDVRLLQLIADRLAQAIDHARLYAAAQEARAEAAAHASHLETMFETIIDGVLLYDRSGQLMQVNSAGRALLGLDGDPDDGVRSYAEQAERLILRDEQGRALPAEQRPIAHLPIGDLAPDKQALDIQVRTPDGREVVVNGSGAPVRDSQGSIIGGIAVLRDVTQRRHLEQRTHQALNALLGMAQALVPEPIEQAAPAEGAWLPVSPVAAQLATLTSNVLDCQGVSICVLDVEHHLSYPLAAVGLLPGGEKCWWAEEGHCACWVDGTHMELIARLQAGETLVLDAAQSPSQVEPIPPSPQTLVVPMRISEQLVGFMLVALSRATQHYSAEELALTEAAAKLGALVIERERLLREREEARANELALREANRQMDVFLGMASHELKTPLTTIKLNLQLTRRRLEHLLCEDTSRAQALSKKLAPVLEQFTRTDRQAERLERLVNDLLDTSRIQAGKLELRVEFADLACLLREVVEEQSQANPGRAIRMHLPATQQALIFADADRIGQVITNYLTNALKYSVAEGPVEVGLEVEEGTARVWVRDEGPGLSAEEQEHIWERFHRVPGIEVQSGSGIGLGLGLYISRAIIEQHHGQVGVQSTRGAGSTFWFTVPLATPEPAQEGSQADAPEGEPRAGGRRS